MENSCIPLLVPARHSSAKSLQSHDFTLLEMPISDRVSASRLGGGISMFENSLRDNLKNMMIGLGLTVAVVGTGLAVAFW